MFVTAEMKALVGHWGCTKTSPEPVERGSVRRYAQAIMDEDPAYMDAVLGRADVALAPPLFPMNMFRRPFGARDLLTERANDPDFDGLTADVALGLPELDLPVMVLLNGGTSIEFVRYARHEESVQARSRYLEISEKQARSGPMVVVVVETEYRGANEELLMVVQKTLLRRPA